MQYGTAAAFAKIFHHRVSVLRSVTAVVSDAAVAMLSVRAHMVVVERWACTVSGEEVDFVGLRLRWL